MRHLTEKELMERLPKLVRNDPELTAREIERMKREIEQAEAMIRPGYYKVEQSGGSYVTATFYNPETGDEYFELVRDYDDDRCRNDLLYDLPINHEMARRWMHSQGVILVGDTAKVIKGRKVPIGTLGKVVEIRPYHDKYGRYLCDYLYFADGQRTNRANCVLEVANI